MKNTMKIFLVIVLFSSMALAEGNMGTGALTDGNMGTGAFADGKTCRTGHTCVLDSKSSVKDISILGFVKEYLKSIFW